MNSEKIEEFKQKWLLAHINKALIAMKYRVKRKATTAQNLCHFSVLLVDDDDHLIEIALTNARARTSSAGR